MSTDRCGLSSFIYNSLMGVLPMVMDILTISNFIVFVMYKILFVINIEVSNRIDNSRLPDGALFLRVPFPKNISIRQKACIIYSSSR